MDDINIFNGLNWRKKKMIVCLQEFVYINYVRIEFRLEL